MFFNANFLRFFIKIHFFALFFLFFWLIEKYFFSSLFVLSFCSLLTRWWNFLFFHRFSLSLFCWKSFLNVLLSRSDLLWVRERKRENLGISNMSTVEIGGFFIFDIRWSNGGEFEFLCNGFLISEIFKKKENFDFFILNFL